MHGFGRDFTIIRKMDMGQDPFQHSQSYQLAIINAIQMPQQIPPGF